MKLFSSFKSGAAVLLTLAAFSSAALAQRAETNVPRGVQLSKDLGPADPRTEINITVHLKLQDKAAFDRAVDALYNPTSPTFHKWMTDAQIAKYAASPAQRLAVRQELERNGMTIVSADKYGFTLRAHGTIANVEGAFNTRIHEFERNGKQFRAHVQDAHLTGELGNYVSAVAGIESHTIQPMLKRASNLKTGKPLAPIQLKNVTPGTFPAGSTNQCLSAPATYNMGSSPTTAVYTGTQYMAASGDSTLACDYLPSELQNALGLNDVYAAGYTGQGQTIVLVEAYGYPTLEKDANTYYQLANLPLLNSKNFQILYPQGKPNPTLGLLTGWYTEIALDMDSSHSVAPGANIVVLATVGQDSEDFQDSIMYAVQNHIGNALSNSYEEDLDLLSGPMEQTSWDNVLEVASAAGVSVNFSTGDSGDDGLGTSYGSPGVPSVAPHATAIGGTSILNDPYNPGRTITTSWGDTVSFLESGGYVVDPPTGGAFFIFGGGGGESTYWPKPAWQSALPGANRQTPDVSALADPYTGFPIIFTVDGTQYIEFGVGGTSLASPIFTAFWTLANQANGSSLGQAGPAIAATPWAVQDVLAGSISSPANPAGSITDSNGTTAYTANDLLSGALYKNKNFTSAFWPLDSIDVADFGFGVDTSLTVGKGWDNSTGFGTPYGLAFINAITGK